MSKHICWRGFKRMCDRCSHSLFHAPDLNNSPRADNPCTQDHLHGTAEPGNFRLRPSVRFCSITAPSAQGAPFRHVSTQPKEESPLFLHRTIFSPHSPPHPTCFIASRALSLACTPCIAREHISDTVGGPSWGAQLQLPSTGTPPHPSFPTTSSLRVQESHCPQLVIELRGSAHSRGIICADSCSIRLETLASADNLPALFLPPSSAYPPPPPLETPHTPLGLQRRG